jgi:hypothetical protein
MQTADGYTLMDVHGAGSQRSDPKSGDASRFPRGRGPQGDVIRIDNFVRCVRGLSTDFCQQLANNGDMDCDCDIDARDLARFANNWSKTPCSDCKTADITNDGNINADDLGELCTNWLAGDSN